MPDLKTIEQKLDRLTESQNKIQVSIAEQRQIDKNHQSNIDRFWDNTIPDIMGKIDGNQTQIATLEVSLAELRTRMVIWGTCLTVGVPALIAIVQAYVTWGAK